MCACVCLSEREERKRAWPCFCDLLSCVHSQSLSLLDTHCSPHTTQTQAKEVSLKALERLSMLNRRTLDGIAARIYFYYAWSHEQLGQLADVRR